MRPIVDQTAVNTPILPPDEIIAVIRLLDLEVLWHESSNSWKIMVEWVGHGCYWSVANGVDEDTWRRALTSVVEMWEEYNATRKHTELA